MGKNFIFVTTIPMGKKYTSNFFGVSLHCSWLLVGSDCNWIQYCDYWLPSPPPSWIIVHWLHPILNFNVSIISIVNINVFYYTSSHVNINCVYCCYLDNQYIGFILSSISMCLLFVSWKSVFFCRWSSLIWDSDVLFLQGYFSIFPISTPPTSPPLCPENENVFWYLIWLSVLMFSHIEIQLFTKIWFQIFFLSV